MRLASIHWDGQDRIAAAAGEDALVDLNLALEATGGPAFGSMLDLVRGGPGALNRARRALDWARDNPDGLAPIPAYAVTWHPPVRRPGKIIGVALNNSAADDRKISAPDHPTIFMKPATCLVGHGEPIPVRPHYGRLHPEPELAVVVGRDGKDIDPARAMDHVFGYTIFNDMTGNDMRGEDRVHYWALYPDPDDPDKVQKVEQHLSYTARYKGADGFGPAGPWLATADEVPDPHDLDISCSLAGEVFTDDNTRHYTYRVEEVLAFVSRFMTLEAGDMISMGTAFRAAKTGGRPLHAADLSRFDGPVEVAISGLGRLSNPVRRLPAPATDWRLPR
ncbi:MAG: fumarylacetoacetate hydrolase family protein [Rhodospirillaceae bacterium]|nr:fumarylacetoacetate hydrolase family protein [Rhodospirillaceae bacterium]MYB14127.1 fumarylacetoacetate hydrolase family protein [Rhodospirillaceae bacterium]MYI49594.1 fumarylacetoacetate hydrolase family protein [Rhodospirillaceae bacterium]